MTRGALLFVIGALLSCLSIGCGCVQIHTYRDYTVSDADITTVLGGASMPTLAGCVTVCDAKRCAELGVRGDAGVSCGGGVVGCNLADHTLTCAFEFYAC
jgi:hypothetical protein